MLQQRVTPPNEFWGCHPSSNSHCEDPEASGYVAISTLRPNIKLNFALSSIGRSASGGKVIFAIVLFSYLNKHYGACYKHAPAELEIYYNYLGFDKSNPYAFIESFGAFYRISTIFFTSSNESAVILTKYMPPATGTPALFVPSHLKRYGPGVTCRVSSVFISCPCIE